MIISLDKFKKNTGGSGGESDLIDFSLIGYNKQQTEEVLTILNADLKKSADVVNSWDPKNTSAANKFHSRTDFSYAPYIDTSNVTNMRSMFYECASLQYIPKYNTSNVTDMSSMFSGCASLKEIPALDTSNVTTMNSMFIDCSSLKEVPVLDTSKVTNMSNMFPSCTKLEKVNGIDFSSLTTAPSSFWGWGSLNNLRKVTLNGKIDFSWPSSAFDYTPNIDYDSIMSILTAMSKTTNTNAKTMAFNSTTDSTNEITSLIDTCTSLGWTINGLTLKYPDRVYTGKEFYEAGFIKPLNENILIEVDGDDIIISGWDKLPHNYLGYYLDLYLASPIYWYGADISCKIDVPYSLQSTHKIEMHDGMSVKYPAMNSEQNLTITYLSSNKLLRILYKPAPSEDVSASVRYRIHNITTKGVNPQPLATMYNAAHYYVTDSIAGKNIQNLKGLKLYNMYDLIYNDDLGYYICRVIDNEYDEDVYAYSYINRVATNGAANTVSVTYNGVDVPITVDGDYNVAIDLAGINYNEQFGDTYYLVNESDGGYTIMDLAITHAEYTGRKTYKAVIYPSSTTEYKIYKNVSSWTETSRPDTYEEVVGVVNGFNIIVNENEASINFRTSGGPAMGDGEFGNSFYISNGDSEPGYSEPVYIWYVSHAGTISFTNFDTTVEDDVNYNLPYKDKNTTGGEETKYSVSRGAGKAVNFYVVNDEKNNPKGEWLVAHPDLESGEICIFNADGYEYGTSDGTNIEISTYTLYDLSKDGVGNFNNTGDKIFDLYIWMNPDNMKVIFTDNGNFEDILKYIQ